jgi:nucleoside recognition membrane protein YjiH
MKLKFDIKQFLISLVLSPIVFYFVVGIAKIFGASYRISHGEAFIIWLLLAILIKISFINKK